MVPDLTAGIIAIAGETKSFTNNDIASVVISSGKTRYKLMKALKTPPKEMSSMKALFKGAKNVVKIAASTIELIDAIATPPLMQDISMWDELYNQKLDVRNEEMIARMNSEVFSSLPCLLRPVGRFDGIARTGLR